MCIYQASRKGWGCKIRTIFGKLQVFATESSILSLNFVKEKLILHVRRVGGVG